MTTTEGPRDASDGGVGLVDTKLEVVVIPVSDVDRAKAFYASLGWRLDADLGGGELRIVQFNPPGSACSIQFGVGLTSAAPGSAQCLLVVNDIEAARDSLVAHGVVGAEVFHDASGGFNRFDPSARASGPDPERRTYASFG
ncbi:MAG TPA: VOC family protein, partial [Acidimicrobiia bacterium]|nr:VOC family protein [Acidimicrobiia bacterium]